ncbi:hypothetical protein H8B15_16605 [Hymenobacter sp. BT507]|uniref:Uncharacterized protein n=1 Tax=Hymenobacter citatus TaxID=2763506 RepID=A0ABR7MN79_9BACT|nr:hypothetical protein [Hymenobacter citatus]MBC6612545.1 hypothetical protein [Hymenobacter citatus]
MLTKRTFLLIFTGLLTGYAATAQSATPATAGPQPTDVLSWLAWGLAAVVLLFGMMTASSLASAVAYSVQEKDTPEEATRVVSEATPAAPTVSVAPTPTLPAEQKVAA